MKPAGSTLRTQWMGKVHHTGLQDWRRSGIMSRDWRGGLDCEGGTWRPSCYYLYGIEKHASGNQHEIVNCSAHLRVAQGTESGGAAWRTRLVRVTGCPSEAPVCICFRRQTSLNPAFPFASLVPLTLIFLSQSLLLLMCTSEPPRLRQCPCLMSKCLWKPGCVWVQLTFVLALIQV